MLIATDRTLDLRQGAFVHAIKFAPLRESEGGSFVEMFSRIACFNKYGYSSFRYTSVRRSKAFPNSNSANAFVDVPVAVAELEATSRVSP